jgi:hypothetical protein
MRMFVEGGPGMWLVLFVGVATIGVSITYAKGNRELRNVAWGLVVACVLVGAGLMLYNRGRVEEVIGMVELEMRDRIREAGYEEASRPLQLGGIFALLGALIAGYAESRRNQ